MDRLWSLARDVRLAIFSLNIHTKCCKIHKVNAWKLDDYRIKQDAAWKIFLLHFFFNPVLFLFRNTVDDLHMSKYVAVTVTAQPFAFSP